ncbi:hypothetical protein AVEN_12004-1 [Araneus ventricosus]|uniref:PiggyBac transposable element-derived protein domain-containing protein n=1 Tax=Araneus ventricosus TaxID=182803 RepID=A0A4Y2G3J2_ARAVE|nr:hypothetical protein AVEN_12004-1 [Araneus ventricosus]
MAMRPSLSPKSSPIQYEYDSDELENLEAELLTEKNLMVEGEIQEEGSEPQAEEEGPQLKLEGSRQRASDYYGKQKCFTWSGCPVRLDASETTTTNIIRVCCSSLEGPARQFGKTPRQIWDLLFTPNLTEEIIEHTKTKLRAMRSKLQNQDSVAYKNMDKDELDALFAIIYYCAQFSSVPGRASSHSFPPQSLVDQYSAV